MENILKKIHSGIITQIHCIQAIEIPSVHPNLQYILSKHQVVFSTSRGVHDNSIPLISGNLTPNALPYHHPFSQKNEIEKKIDEFLKARVIHPSTIPYYSHVIMVFNK
jgi:hypothetical protein